MNFGQVAFGLRQVKLTAPNGSGVITLPAAMMLHFTPKFITAQFEAEGIVIAGRGMLSHVEWELEAGGISLEAYSKMSGLPLTNAGTTPNRTVKIVGSKAIELPYFRVYGKARGEGSDDVHCKLFKCKLTALEGTFRQGEFWVSSCGGIAVHKSTADGIFEFVQHETQAEL